MKLLFAVSISSSFVQVPMAQPPRTGVVAISQVPKESDDTNFPISGGAITTKEKSHKEKKIDKIKKQYEQLSKTPFNPLHNRYKSSDYDGKVKDTETFMVTAYCRCSKCCGHNTGITASGTKVKQGRTCAADLSIFSIGTKLLINGHIYTVEDTGVKGRVIDVYFNSHQEALQWGMRKLKIKKICRLAGGKKNEKNKKNRT